MLINSFSLLPPLPYAAVAAALIFFFAHLECTAAVQSADGGQIIFCPVRPYLGLISCSHHQLDLIFFCPSGQGH